MLAGLVHTREDNLFLYYVLPKIERFRKYRQMKYLFSIFFKRIAVIPGWVLAECPVHAFLGNGRSV